MARSPSGEGSQVEATTLIFPKKSAWDELSEAKRTQQKRAQSASGYYSKIVTRLVEEEHMDRRAAQIVLKLDLIEDDEDLHVTLFHIFDGIKKRGILKRAMAAEDLFDNLTETISDAVKEAKASGKKTRAGGGKKGATTDEKLPDNVTSIGAAARNVAEQAGQI